MVAMPTRRIQQGVTIEEVCNVLARFAPAGARQRVSKDGRLLFCNPSRAGGLIDRKGMEQWQEVLQQLLKLNPNGIYNQSLLQEALGLFDKNCLGGIITDPKHACMVAESFPGEHLGKQSLILKKLLQGISRIKSNTTVGSRHPGWLWALLTLLDGSGDDPNDPTTRSATTARSCSASSTERIASPPKDPCEVVIATTTTSITTITTATTCYS